MNNTSGLNGADRMVVNRFCLSVGTRVEFATKCLRTPLTTQVLDAAFAECEERVRREASEMQARIADYDNMEFSESAIAYFGGKPTKRDLEEYYDRLIEQSEEALRAIRLCYSVSVDCDFPSPAARDLHLSFNPRATFGYSNQLHEECSAALTQSLREMLSKTGLCCVSAASAEYQTFGAFYLEATGCYYEDLRVYAGERCILSTITHEEMYDLDLSADQLAALEGFENKPARNKLILAKLCAC